MSTAAFSRGPCATASTSASTSPARARRIAPRRPSGRARGSGTRRGASPRAPEASAASTATSTFSALPVLQLPDEDCTPEEEAAFCVRLRDVCHTVGFFYVANHGIAPKVTVDVLEASRAFFALPHDVKQGIANVNSPAFRGYVRLGAENTAGRPDWREQIEMGVEADAPGDETGAKADTAGVDADTAGDRPVYDVLVGPNQWPEESACPGFRRRVTAFLDDAASLSRRLMELLALSLDLPRDFFDDDFRGRPNVQAKIASCPSAPEGSPRASSFGVGAHTDSGYLSLLLQDDVGGLQVQNGHGEWIDAMPIDGTLVVNLGEMLQLRTRGYYLATPHRVVSKAASGAGSPPRLSVPYFWNPRLDAVIEPMESLPETLTWLRPEPEDVAETRSHGDGGNRLIGEYGLNALKSLARSHPEVMARHHPDLEVMRDGSVVRRAPRR